MPSPSQATQIQGLWLDLENLKGRLASAEQHLEISNLIQLRERLAVLESYVQGLKAQLDEHKPTREQIEELGGLKTRIAQLEEQKKLGDTRLFQFILLFFGGIITLSVQIILLFFKK